MADDPEAFTPEANSEPEPGSSADANQPSCLSQDPRKLAAKARREQAADLACRRDLDPDDNADNGDEGRYLIPESGEKEDRSFVANYTKGMSHNKLGEVSPRSDYLALLNAVQPTVPPQPPAAFEAIPRGPSEFRQTDPTTGEPIPGVPNISAQLRRYVNPQSAVAFTLMAPDAPQAAVFAKGSFTRGPFPAAPSMSSDQAAAEISEVYWMALLRDVQLGQFQANSTDPQVQEATEFLSQYRDFRGPKVGGQVTPQTLFRGGNVFGDNPAENGGELVGPYLSQFLLIGTAIEEGGGPTSQFSAGESSGETKTGEQVIPPGSSTGLVVSRTEGMVQYGVLTIDQRTREIQPGLDFMTDYPNWISIQEGFLPDSTEKNAFTGNRRFIYSGRQLANYVHFDQTFQTYYTAAFLLLGMQGRANQFKVSLFGEGNPYSDPARVPPGTPSSMNQQGFGTFGQGHLLALLAEADRRSLEAMWYQKWFVQRRLRPEAMGGRIHFTQVGDVKPARYDLGDELFNGPGRQVLRLISGYNFGQNQRAGREPGVTYFLPQIFPEGSPMHPSYGAGHAIEAGTGITILKAFFNEDLEVTDRRTGQVLKGVTRQPALIANDGGKELEIYRGAGDETPLPVWMELNKLAANVATARNIAGVHYRTDYSASVWMGEYIAVGLLQEQAANFNEDQFFQLTLFDRRIIRIGKNGITQVGTRPNPTPSS